MAKAHVLTTAGGATKMVFHVATPSGSNVAGITWVNAVLKSGLAVPTILPDGDGTGGTIAAQEKSDVAAGVVVEVVKSDVAIAPGVTLGTADAYLDALHAVQVTETQALLQARLKFFGYTRA